MENVKYFHGDNTIVRKADDVWPEIDLYRGLGNWKRMIAPEWFFTNADEIDESTAKDMIAEFDKDMPKPAENKPV